MNKSSSRNTLKLNLNDSFSNSNSSKNNINSKTPSKKRIILSSYSSSSHSSKRTNLSGKRNNFSGYFKYNDKVEKKMYLENISLRTKRNSELLSKLSSTFRSFRMQASSKDPLIEANLFKIGVKRSFLLSKRINKVRNMIQNFDNEFSVNLNINNNKFYKNKNDKKNSLQKIEEESFDFDLNNINSKNESKNDDSEINNNSKQLKKNLKKKSSLLITNNFFDDKYNLKSEKGQKFLINNEKIEKMLKNSEKFSQLSDAFKYYELLYNYKYFLTKKDNELLSFSRRKKLEKSFSLYNPIPKTKLYNFEENCEKCQNNKNIDKLLYKNSLNNALKSDLSNSDNSQIENTNNKTQNENNNLKNKELILSLDNSDKKNQKKLKRAISGFTPKKRFNKNIITNTKNNSNTRPTTASISQTQYSSKYSNPNKLKFNSKIKKDLYLESVISNTSSYKTNLYHNKKSLSISPQKDIISLSKKIKNLSKEILDIGGNLKIGLKSNYKSVMKLIEEEKKPVIKVRKDRNINIKNIRKNLNLKRRGNGINEIKLVMENVDKLYKSLPKTHVNLMRSIAKIVINEDRMRHRPIFYNDTYDNKLFKMRLKNEMFEAQCEMAKIRKTLSKNKKEKNFKEQVKKLMKNEMFLFFDLDSLKQMLNKYKVLRGECLGNN